MTHVYFDESRHERGNFALGALLFCDTDPSDTINAAVTAVGLTPGKDEYKSRHPHASDHRWRDLRSRLFAIAQGSRIGLVVAPYADAKRLGQHALAGLAHILSENDFARPIIAWFDEGLFTNKGELAAATQTAALPDEVALNVECDSRVIPGIQVADLVAHACATTLLGRLGIADKLLRDDEEGEYQLSFEMWARLRYNFLVRDLHEPEQEDAAAAGLMDSKGGLYIAPDCDEAVVNAALQRFGYTWLGCIH